LIEDKTMKIKWNSNFQIEDSTVQCAVAYVHIDSFKVFDSTTDVEIIIRDESETMGIKQYKKIYDKKIENIETLYGLLVSDFADAEIVE